MLMEEEEHAPPHQERRGQGAHSPHYHDDLDQDAADTSLSPSTLLDLAWTELRWMILTLFYWFHYRLYANLTIHACFRGLSLGPKCLYGRES